jgi:hypothetical protein
LEEVVAFVCKILKVVAIMRLQGQLKLMVSLLDVEIMVAAVLDHPLLALVPNQAENLLVAALTKFHQCFEDSSLSLAKHDLGSLLVSDDSGSAALWCWVI